MEEESYLNVKKIVDIKRKEFVIKLYNDGESIEKIMQIFNLTKEEIENIIKEGENG